MIEISCNSNSEATATWLEKKPISLVEFVFSLEIYTEIDFFAYILCVRRVFYLTFVNGKFINEIIFKTASKKKQAVMRRLREAQWVQLAYLDVTVEGRKTHHDVIPLKWNREKEVRKIELTRTLQKKGNSFSTFIPFLQSAAQILCFAFK